ncbi:hypothetical protein [Streptomyces platensis]
MATARSLNFGRRHRPSAVPFRLLWLAALRLGVLVAHGARAESPRGPTGDRGAGRGLRDRRSRHPARARSRRTCGASAPPGGHHSDELCLSGRPRQGAPASPCARPLTGPSHPAPVPVHGGRLSGAPPPFRDPAAPRLRGAAGLNSGHFRTYPFERDTVVRLSGDRLAATHDGLHNTFCGIGITLSKVLTVPPWTRPGRPDCPHCPGSPSPRRARRAARSSSGRTAPAG